MDTDSLGADAKLLYVKYTTCKDHTNNEDFINKSHSMWPKSGSEIHEKAYTVLKHCVSFHLVDVNECALNSERCGEEYCVNSYSSFSCVSSKPLEAGKGITGVNH